MILTFEKAAVDNSFRRLAQRITIVYCKRCERLLKHFFELEEDKRILQISVKICLDICLFLIFTYQKKYLDGNKNAFPYLSLKNPSTELKC